MDPLNISLLMQVRCGESFIESAAVKQTYALWVGGSVQRPCLSAPSQKSMYIEASRPSVNIWIAAAFQDSRHITSWML
jgi:hypothetical protein